MIDISQLTEVPEEEAAIYLNDKGAMSTITISDDAYSARFRYEMNKGVNSQKTPLENAIVPVFFCLVIMIVLVLSLHFYEKRKLFFINKSKQTYFFIKRNFSTICLIIITISLFKMAFSNLILSLFDY